MLSFLKLIRLPNLIIIGLTQYVMRYFIIQPILEINNIQSQLSDLSFAILVLATLFVAAGAYVINDYFDAKADRLNERDVIVGRKISRRIALFLHQVFSVVGLALAAYVSCEIGHWQFTLIFFIAGGLLWFYSTSYKNHYILGKLILACICAAIPFLVVIYEIPPLNKAYGQVLAAPKIIFDYLLYWVGAFSFFSFLGVLIYQLVRDLISLKGDREAGRRSLPFVIGFRWTKVLIVSLILFLSVSVFYVWYQFLNAPIDKITPWYFTFLIILPLLWLSYLVIKLKKGENLTFGVFLLRLAILAGIAYAFVVNYILSTTNF